MLQARLSSPSPSSLTQHQRAPNAYSLSRCFSLGASRGLGRTGRAEPGPLREMRVLRSATRISALEGGAGGPGSGGIGGVPGGGGGGGLPEPEGNGPRPMTTLTCVFGAFVLGGGLMGYIKKGSTTSLVASTAVSLLLFVSASLMGRPDQRIGSLLALGTCLALGALMGKRYKDSRKVFPAGVLTVLSSAMAIGHLKTLL
ncbi:hypothetical protein ACKKBF_B36680 [Auxenochlorella protothecoides x Auxenochlorella symbiontica]